MSFILARKSSHEQRRLASTSCVKGSKECLSSAVRLSACARVWCRATEHTPTLRQCWRPACVFRVLPLMLSSLGNGTPHHQWRKALVGSGLGPFECPEPFILVGALLIALRIRLRRWMFGVGSPGEFNSKKPSSVGGGPGPFISCSRRCCLFPWKKFFLRHPYIHGMPRSLGFLPPSLSPGSVGTR